jgi:hypothetical protein
MEPLLDLPIDQFFGALDELGLDPERRSDLLRDYRRRNSAFSPVYGLLDSVAGEDAGEGMERATFAPVSRPAGMSVADAVRSGQAQFALPQGLLDVVGGVAQAVDAPASAARGLIPADDMTGEALNLAGMAQLGGAAMPAPRGALRSAALGTADDVMETPAQRVARLLREGRADEVTDDLMAQVDPQEMARFYESGATGMDMPLDEASRMARAQEMGFDRWGVHGTWGDNADYPAFDQRAVYMSDDPNVSATYILDRDRMGTMYPIGMRAQYGRAGIDAGGDFWHTMPSSQVADESWAFGLVDDAGHLPSMITTRDVEQAARMDGLSGAEFRNVIDSGLGGPAANQLRASNVTVAFHPNQVRSRFARFDPRLGHLANLSAANVDPLTGAAAMGASQQQQDPLASLRAYLAQNGLLSQ